MLSIFDSGVRDIKFGSISAYLPLSAYCMGVPDSEVSKPALEMGREQMNQALKLNELANQRPFNILYKVKRHDPL